MSDVSGSGDDFVGQEIDAQIGYKVARGVTLSTGAGYFFAGDYIKNNASGNDDFLFGFLQLAFSLN